MIGEEQPFLPPDCIFVFYALTGTMFPLHCVYKHRLQKCSKWSTTCQTTQAFQKTQGSEPNAENSSQEPGFHSGCIFNTIAFIVIERSYKKGLPEPIQQPITLQLHEHWQTAWGRSLSAAHAVSSFSSSGTCSSNLEGSDEAEPLGILLT